MDETEVERLVVRLTGDGAEYMKMLEEVKASTEKTAKVVQQNTQSMEQTINSLAGAVKNVSAAFTAGFFGSVLKSSVDTFEKAEMNAIRMEATLKANGREVESTTRQYREFAAQMARTTVSGAGQTMALLRTAETFDLTGVHAERATRSAMALAAANDSNASAMIRLTAAIEKGDIAGAKRFARLVPQLRGVKNETEFLDKYNRLVAGGMEVMTKEAGTLGGMLQRLANMWKGVQKEMGAMVVEFVKPVIEGMQSAVEWFKSLSKEVKTTIMIFMGLVVVIGAIKAAIFLAGIVFNTMFGGIGLLLGIILTAGAAGIAAWINYLGGVKEAWDAIMGVVGKVWDWIQERITAFWQWFRPIWRAFYGYATAVWEGIQAAAQAVWDFIVWMVTDLWNYWTQFFADLLGSSGITLEQIQGYFVDFFLYAEFGARNFTRIMQFAWTMIQLGAVTTFEIIKHFFTVAMPEYMAWFSRNWMKIIDDLVTNAGILLSELVANMIRVASNLPGLIRGTVNWSDVWQPMGQALQNTVEGLPAIAERQIGELEQTLRDQAILQGMELYRDWQSFRERRLAEIYEPDPTELRAAREAGEQLGSAMAGGTAKEMKKMDAVLTNSAEAIAKFAAQQETYGKKTTEGGTARNANPQEWQRSYFERIAQAVEQTAKTPPVQLQGAGL